MSERVRHQNKTISAQIYSNKQLLNITILYKIRQVTGSETLYPGLSSRSSGRFEDWSTDLSAGEG